MDVFEEIFDESCRAEVVVQAKGGEVAESVWRMGCEGSRVRKGVKGDGIKVGKGG